ncbi:MAG: c-type cytochrome [Xanthomonadales bacterium]|nr:cytochrome c [Xanthomonadales bacterium]NIX13810.1 c-type cytochrome [Xanthomonadales bacterium]
MKTFTTIFTTMMLMIVSGAAAGETVVREKALTWEDVARLDGPELYANLCAACHGVSGKGDGPAAKLIDKAVPDLTVIANGSRFPHKQVEIAISGNKRSSHGTIDMPAWGDQFRYLRPGWNAFLRDNYARERIHTLATHLETLQGGPNILAAE